MDITQQELKTMKLKDVRKLIRESIAEVLTEDEAKIKQLRTQVADIRTKISQLDTQKQPLLTQISNLEKQIADETAKDTKQDQAANTALKQAATNENLSETNLDEVKTYRITDPNFNTSSFANKRIKGTPISDMLDWIKANPGISAKQFKEKYGFPKEQGANNFLNAFWKEGILTKLDSGGIEITNRQSAIPGEEESDEVVTGPEALFVGKGDLSQYFDNVPNADGEEDFNAEEEPTVGDIEPGTPATTGGMSDEDYEAFMKYDDLKNRLDATKSNLLKIKRRKGTAGDIGDKPSTEEQRLRDLKKSLEDRVNALVAGSKYLQKKIEKQTGKAYEPIEIEPEEEETIDESFNVEYEKRKLQYYAGIIK